MWTSRHFTLSTAKSIQPIPCHPICFTSILVSHLCLVLTSGLFPSGLPTRNHVFSLPSVPHYMHLVLLDLIKQILFRNTNHDSPHYLHFLSLALLPPSYTQPLSSAPCSQTLQYVIPTSHTVSNQVSHPYIFWTLQWFAPLSQRRMIHSRQKWYQHASPTIDTRDKTTDKTPFTNIQPHSTIVLIAAKRSPNHRSSTMPQQRTSFNHSVSEMNQYIENSNPLCIPLGPTYRLANQKPLIKFGGRGYQTMVFWVSAPLNQNSSN